MPLAHPPDGHTRRKPRATATAADVARDVRWRDDDRYPTPHEERPMPAGSSPKRERQYEHIKESYKERREHGETKAQKKR